MKFKKETKYLLKFDDVYDFFLLRFVHFVMYEKPQLFEDVFSPYLQRNNYQMRRNTINLPVVRTNIEKQFTIFQVCRLMREITPNFLSPQSNYVLKKNFKQYALSRY